jgi:hypothetical protein
MNTNMSTPKPYKYVLISFFKFFYKKCTLKEHVINFLNPILIETMILQTIDHCCA